MAFGLRRPGARTAPGATAEDPAVVEENGPRRVGRARVATARGAWAVGSVMLALARLVRLIVGIIVLLIVVAIVLRVLDANTSNTIVRDVHDAAKALVGPFDNLFAISKPKLAIAVNWGIAALVYLFVGGLIARFIARAAPRGVHPAEPVL